MNTKSKVVKFNNQQVPVFMQEDKPYVLMKPICENIGLDWRSQLKRIKRNHVLSQGVVVMTTPSTGGEQDYVALPLGYLNGWLMGVDANKVKPEIKDTLIKYQLECYDVLYKHFMPKPVKPVDLTNYVLKDQHDKLVLKYHQQFRQYDDLVDTLRGQIQAMQYKCHRYDYRMSQSSISLDAAAQQLNVRPNEIRKVLFEQCVLEERRPYIESHKTILKLTDKGKSMNIVYIQNDIVCGDVKEVIMINEDGMAFLHGRV
ncbi:phage antirepressor N-terminal domain-containing protein [Acinetobacter ursingii]|uniref:phage antirepressor N-terminal domain-containing protein n=1 Tax=Acinetobacter ursingii TaxID=108980 RepID=UPI001250B360|nr:phage antirepressor N-terminal domain-containing protein [Acinetobacter ursingii]MCU4496372.1 phage antirepressor N-terminal domain-containing protein [Acinetobacter ursingii]